VPRCRGCRVSGPGRLHPLGASMRTRPHWLDKRRWRRSSNQASTLEAGEGRRPSDAKLLKVGGSWTPVDPTSTCDWRGTPSAPLAALKPPFSRERAAVDQPGERCHVRNTDPERVHIFRFPAARPSPVSHYARVPEPTQRRERLTTSLTAHLPRRCILRRIYSRGGGRGSGHGFSSKDDEQIFGRSCGTVYSPQRDRWCGSASVADDGAPAGQASGVRRAPC
jgi:hypothetical protein